MTSEVSTINHWLSAYAMPWAINITLALIIFFVGRIVVKWAVTLIDKVLVRANVDAILINFIKAIAHAVLLLFVVVASLNKLGVDTTSLVALLGAAGLAIGLSLQGSLQNFAAGVMLLVFRPFKAGDMIEAAGTAGIVEQITIFTCKLRTGDNKEVIIPNNAIYSGNIINYSARDTRRVDMTFGIGYQSDLKKAKSVLEEVVKTHPLVLQNPEPLVAVAALADSSVNFVVRPWVNTVDYWTVFYQITEQVKLRFDQEGIEIPFPQMDIHIQKVD